MIETVTRPARVMRLGRIGHATMPTSDQRHLAGWQTLRALLGATRPSIPTYATRRSRLDTLRHGERFLILLRHAGIGDHLIASMLFPALREQYPEVQVTYAIPSRFHPLFAGTDVQVLAYDGGFDRRWLGAYDLIEDINTPCHAWEFLFVGRGGTDGDGHGLRWRNRLDIFSRWFGLKIQTPRSDIAISEGEKTEARRLLLRTRTNGRPVCLLSPFSLDQAKCYPWFAELATRLEADRWCVRFLHSAPIPGPVPTLAGLPLRLMGAVVAVADLIVSVDSAAFHWGGILRRPTVGIFNSNQGQIYCRDYPTAHPVQTCPTPCIHNVRWGADNETCPRLTAETLPQMPGRGPAMSRCFARASVDQILATVREVMGSAGSPRKEHLAP